MARVHNEAASFAAEHDRFRLDLDHLLSRPLVRLDQILDARPTDRKYLARLSERLRRQVGERAAELSQCVCHGDCHGFNAVIDGDGSATLVDFDDGGPGWVAYDLCVFLWSARAFAPQRRGLWLHFLDGYRSVRPIARADLDAVSLFVPLRHIWLLGEYAAGAGGWGSWWLGEWFNRQIAFLRAWEQEQLSDPSACISRWTSRRSRESAVFREEHMPETASERLARFDPLVTEVMAEWRIPRFAMAVLRRYEPPSLRCWGVCDIDTGAPVTTDTVFPICSVTKSFTATALALLVDEGKLEWDRPVREYLPEFRLRNPVATDQATLRDLLTHRTGLPRHTWVYMAGHLDNAGMFEALRYLEPSRPFRSAYQYSNLSPGWCSSASAANTGKILFGPGSWRRSAWSGPRLRSKTCSRSTRIARCRI